MTTNAPSHSHHEGHPAVGHVAPMWMLVAVWLALMVFTYLTVAATYIDVGPSMNLLIAMAIATVKATLVVLFFMHLYWDQPYNAILFIISLAFVGLLIAWAMMDAEQYHPQIILDYQPYMDQVQGTDSPLAPNEETGQ